MLCGKGGGKLLEDIDRSLIPALYGWDDLVHPLGSQEMPPGWPISSFTKLSYNTSP